MRFQSPQVYDPTDGQVMKVSKEAKIRNRYNQVPHLTQDTTWEWKVIVHAIPEDWNNKRIN